MKNNKRKAEEYDRLKALVMKCSIDKYGCIIGIKPSDMFPELAESEDERIRKEITKLVMQPTWKTEKEFHGRKELCAWLEKQGTSYTKKDVDDAYLEGVTNTKNEIEKQYEANYQIRKDIATFIFNYRGDIKDRTKWIDYLGIKVSFVEKQGEHNLADTAKTCKEEPKFRNGQWIVWQGNCYKINYNGCGYELVDQNGLSTSLEYGTIDENAHLWDITKDANDGDVLCTYECDEPKIVFILKGAPKKHYALSYHCYYNIMYPHFDTDSKNGCLAPNDEDLKPATKEQRDLLFQKMKEAGYEWDVKKKELKKIEQKSVCSEEDEKEYRRVEYAIMKVFGGDAYLIGWIRKFKNKLLHQTAWKPSDEQIESLQESIGIVGELTPRGELLKGLVEQLKKLKEGQL